MKKLLPLVFILISFGAKAQKVDSIYVNLYTDSLKKGTHNYINVDGLMSNGKYLPLDSTRIIFVCDEAAFTGNTLFIPADFKGEKVKIRVKLKADVKMYREFEMYIKQTEDPALKSEAELLAEMKGKKKIKKKEVVKE